MTQLTPTDRVFIGWDVGGWNCDKNSNSRDALVMLDQQRQCLGKPWRGNLRETINTARSTEDWIRSLLSLCAVELDDGVIPKVTLAIDTPLGFSQAFQNLINGEGAVSEVRDSASNPYLFRATEHYLFQQGLKPLSPIKDMIGSQATKGIHTLAQFAAHNQTTGVWKDRSDESGWLTAIEAYPSPCKQSALIKKLLTEYLNPEVVPTTTEALWDIKNYLESINHEDKRDALICALVGWLHRNQPESVAQPTADIPKEEGWIFLPLDSLPQKEGPELDLFV